MITTSEITNKKFAVFMTVAFSALIPVSIAAIAYKNGNMILFLFLFRIIAILLPLIGVLAARLPFKSLGWKPKFKFKYFITALIGPQILSWLGAGIFFLFNRSAFGLGLEGLASQLPAESVAAMQQLGVTPEVLLPVLTIMSLTFLPITQILPSLGEEAGWRGVMYPFLKGKLGSVPGRIVGGALWGVWHWPLIILGNYFYDGDYIGKPFLGPVMICLTLCAFGILIDYLYEKTNCIWIPSLMHASMNAATLPVMLLTAGGTGSLSVLGPTCFALIGCLPVMAVSLVILFAGKGRKKAA
ncbi:MAG: CPBP family intramembrane metalloprotease [Clostridiales bacterium]|nr:CPBP family intramembrane metalloprotease [Clostridiales bacterium]